MITYVRYWQNSLNEMLIQKGLCAFRFNTYIISVLVIFFLQLNQNFPKLSDVPPSHTKSIDHVPQFHMEKDKFKQTIGQFFKFYGEKFQMKRQIISVNIGRWQERILQSEQTNFTLEQKRFLEMQNYFVVEPTFFSTFIIFFFTFRLQDGINSNAWNWKNCTMYVQDIKYPGTNITAEISEEEANNFQQMCKMFASYDSYGQSIDVYLLQMGKVQSANTNGSTMTRNDRTSAPKSVHELSKALQCSDDQMNTSSSSSCSSSSSICDGSRASSISISSNSVTSQKLKNVINIEQVSQAISSKTVDLINRMVGRCFYEIEIVALLTRYLKIFNSTLKVMPFGSATYGFGGSSNFNILVNAGNKK